MRINTPRYQGQFAYANACDNSMIRIDFAEKIPIVLADHVNAPELPSQLGPGLLLDGNALCEMHRFEINAYCVSSIDGHTRRWRIDVSEHASLAERIASTTPDHELIHEKIHERPATIAQVRAALDHAIRFCRVSPPRRLDDITPSCGWMTNTASVTDCAIIDQTVKTPIPQRPAGRGGRVFHRHWG